MESFQKGRARTVFAELFSLMQRMKESAGCVPTWRERNRKAFIVAVRVDGNKRLRGYLQGVNRGQHTLWRALHGRQSASGAEVRVIAWCETHQCPRVQADGLSEASSRTVPLSAWWWQDHLLISNVHVSLTSHNGHISRDICHVSGHVRKHQTHHVFAVQVMSWWLMVGM